MIKSTLLPSVIYKLQNWSECLPLPHKKRYLSRIIPLMHKNYQVLESEVLSVVVWTSFYKKQSILETLRNLLKVKEDQDPRFEMMFFVFLGFCLFLFLSLNK